MNLSTCFKCKCSGEISDKCQNVNEVKAELDQESPLTSILASSLPSFRLEGNYKKLDFEADITNKPHLITEISSDSLQSVGIECHDDVLDNSRDVEDCGNKLCAKGSKKAKVRNNLKFPKRVKIKGLQVRMAVADQRVDGSYDVDNIVTLRILLILMILIYVLEAFHVSVFY